MAWASVSGPSSSGSRPPNARLPPVAARRGRIGGWRPPRPAVRGASGAMTSRGERQPWARPRPRAARASTRSRDRSYRSSTSSGLSTPADISSRAVPSSGSRREVGGDLGGGPGRRTPRRSPRGRPADTVQVQEGRRAAVAHPGRRGQRGVVDRRQVGAVGVEVPDAGPAGLRGGDPARRRPHADAQAVVLADEQQRQRQPLVGAVGGGVERAGRGRVVDRRVAEAADHDGVRRPGRWPLPAWPRGPARRPGRPRAAGARRSWRSAG